MSTSVLVIGVAAAVLLFWIVGAHNRLVRLRNELLRSFATVDERYAARQPLLERWAEELAEAHAGGAVLRAATRQVETAHQHARARPIDAGRVTSLRLAEEILARTRSALPPADEGLATALAEADSTLAFARERFNEAAIAHNRAVSQFPTWVLAGLLGFRNAGTL